MAQGEPWSPRKKLQQHSGTKRPEQSFTQTLEECLHFVCITQSQAGPGQSQEGLPTRRGALKGETAPDSLPATPKSSPTRRIPSRALAFCRGP